MDYNDFYSKLLRYNGLLLDESNVIKDFYESDKIFDLYITSAGLSLLKNLILGEPFSSSVGNFFLGRIIIEGLALKKYCNSEDCQEINKKLLQKQVFAIEYFQYKQFKEIEGLFDQEKLTNDYKLTKKYFTDLLGENFSNKFIQDVLRSKIPFIVNPYTGYGRKVEQYLGSEIKGLYKRLSWYIHPNVNISFAAPKEREILASVVALLIKEYSALPSQKTDFLTYFKSTVSNEIEELKQIYDRQLQLALDLCNKCYDSYGNNHFANTLQTIVFLINDMLSDFQLGLTEIVKSKYKILLELFAAFDFYITQFCWQDQRYKLLCIHKRMQQKKNLEEDYSQELNEAKKVFDEIYGEEVSLTVRFKKEFEKTDGYLIVPVKGVPTFMYLVKKFANKLGKENGKIAILNYNEAQMLSHANGYDWFANRGCFNDVRPLFQLFDLALLQMMLPVKLVLRMADKINPEVEKAFVDLEKYITDTFETKRKILIKKQVDAKLVD